MGVKTVIVENLQDYGVALDPIPELDVEPRGKISEKDREPREVESGTMYVSTVSTETHDRGGEQEGVGSRV